MDIKPVIQTTPLSLDKIKQMREKLNFEVDPKTGEKLGDIAHILVENLKQLCDLAIKGWQ